MQQIVLSAEPFADAPHTNYKNRGKWPAFWVDLPAHPLAAPSVAVFRRTFTVDVAETVRIHVSADQRFRLLLDGEEIGRGPERGDPQHWRFASFDVHLSPGRHTLVAMCWWLGEFAPFAQMTLRPGFLLAAEGARHDMLSTGIAPWEARLVDAWSFVTPDVGIYYVAGPNETIDGTRYPWGWETGDGSGWLPVVRVTEGAAAMRRVEPEPFWMLTPSTLPAMLREPRLMGVVRLLTETPTLEPAQSSPHLAGEISGWQAWLHGDGEVSVPAHTTHTALIDLQQYYCAYPALTVSGGAGARVQIEWAETLFSEPTDWAKGQRDAVEGKYFRGVGHTFLPDGGAQRTFTPLWWSAGRYVKVTVTTGDAPLTLHRLVFEETRYPLECEATFQCDDPRLLAITPRAVRTLQMCSHETYMDCPYYEQLMYAGDTRTEVLATYAMTSDDRLPRKALVTFDHSRQLSGMTLGRYPCRVDLVMPPFSLWWVMMAYDYWQWRDDPDFVRTLLPGARAVLEYFRTRLRPDGLMDSPNGWNFTDWVPEWEEIEPAVPFDGECAPNGIFNLHLVLALQAKAALESYFGETALAARDLATAGQTMDAVRRFFWDEERGMVADDLAHAHFSEHAQALALLTGLLTPEEQQRVLDGLLHAPDLLRATLYFTHYIFDALYRVGRADAIIPRLAPWFELEQLGLATVYEKPEPVRSECHAWAAHPLHHFFASFLGIRPAAPGFARVRIAPQLGSLTQASGSMPHPAGEVRVSLQLLDSDLHADITLPAGVDGVLVWDGREYELTAGQTSLVIAECSSIA